MKKYILPVSILIAVIFIFGSCAANAQANGKVKAFNESIRYEANNDFSNALDVLIKSGGGNNSYLMNMRLGWLYYKNGEYNDSKERYSAALNQQKRSIEAMLGLTLPLAAMDEWDQVTSVYQSILKIDPVNYYANLRLGQYYLNKGEYQAAKSYLEKVFALYPAEYEINLSLGWTYLYLGEKQKAKELLTSALMMSENDKSATEGLKQLEY